MKKPLALLARLSLATVMFVGTQAVYAASTNAVQNINLQLTFLTQGPYITNSPSTNHIRATVLKNTVATKTVIAWLGAATTNTFSSKARLVRVKHFNASTNSTTIEIRDGTNAAVDVSEFFKNTVSTEKIDGFTLNEVTGLKSGVVHENLHLQLTNAVPFNLIPHFSVGGSATVSYVSVKSGKTVLVADDVSAQNLAGAGVGTNGVPALVTGSLTIIGTATEVK